MHTIENLDHQLLTIAEAAEWTGWSESWVRAKRRWGPLQPASSNGRQAVTAESVRRALAAERRRGRKSNLRLVWINPHK